MKKFSNIRKALVELIEAASSHDYDTIAKCPLNDLFKNKITYLYNRDEYLPIYSDGDLNVVLALLDIPFLVEENRIFKLKKLFDFYKQLERNDISTFDFFARYLKYAGRHIRNHRLNYFVFIIYKITVFSNYSN